MLLAVFASGAAEVNMLTVHQLAKSFALTPLFKNVTFSINSGDRAGLVGPNGCGKTTLLRIIAGQETADFGHVARDAGLRFGYLSQGLEIDDQATVGEIIGRASGSAVVLEADLVSLAQGLAGQPDDELLQSRYDALLQRISTADPGRAERILAGLGLDSIARDLPAARLSGGQKTRLNLALVLLEDPQVLLLDEPTNHLDIGMLEWLEDWLADFAGGALIVSHDRTFLDRTVTRILAMDPQKREVREYSGNYSAYAEQVAQERETQWAAYNDQRQEIRRVKQDIARTMAQSVKSEREASSVRRGGEKMKLKGYKDYQQSIAKKVAQKSKARERKLERYLDSEERVERPMASRNMRLDFGTTAHLGRSVLKFVDLTVGYEAARPLLSDLRLDVAPGARIVLTGPNGSGKTTLLRTIAGRIRPLQGAVERGPSVRLGYMTQEQAGIDPLLSPLQTIRSAFRNDTEARTYLAYFLFTGEEPLKSNSQLSYGQRARLALAQLVVDGCNVLLLDEPVNHLDIPSRERFEQALGSFEGTVIAVVHDRYFIKRFASEVWWVEERGIRRGLMDTAVRN
jgi:ATP-binding cassette subfamily F protein 3